jgi:hypothetical protein
MLAKFIPTRKKANEKVLKAKEATEKAIQQAEKTKTKKAVGKAANQAKCHLSAT